MFQHYYYQFSNSVQQPIFRHDLCQGKNQLSSILTLEEYYAMQVPRQNNAALGRPTLWTANKVRELCWVVAIVCNYVDDISDMMVWECINAELQCSFVWYDFSTSAHRTVLSCSSISHATNDSSFEVQHLVTWWTGMEGKLGWKGHYNHIRIE